MNKRHKHFTEVKSERLTLVRRSSTSPAIRKIRTKTKMKHFIPTRWAERLTVCPYVRWQKYGAAGILVHCWRTCEVMQPFWQPIIHHPVQWFSARGDFAPTRGHLAVSEDILIFEVCLETGKCHWHLKGEAREATKQLTMHKMVSTTKNYSSPNVNSAEVEKL